MAPAGPNVLFFMLDQLSAKWLEQPARRAVPTPNLDALQARGVTFRRAVTSNPVCCPARATLATGLTTRGHGVLQNGYGLDPALPTMYRCLQQAGWRTGAFGKLHFHPHFAGVHPDYTVYGFDEVRNTEDPRAGEWLDWLMAEHPEHVDAALATIWAGALPALRAYGPDGEDLLPRLQAAREGRDWSSPACPGGDAQHYTLPFPQELSQTEWITRQALDFLDRVPAGRPFFAHLGYVQPHGPFAPPEASMAAVDREALPTPLPPTWAEQAHPWCFGELNSARTHLPENWREVRHCYFADLAHLDAQLGRVMAALEKSGRLAKTYVFFLADHGEMLFDHGFNGKGEFHYDACLRVPLVVAGPGLAGGTVREEFVQLEDILPTVLEMAGQPLPRPPCAGPYLQCAPPPLPAGRSLLPLCRGEAAPDWRPAAYSESYNNITSCDPRHWARTLRTERWRYTHYPAGGGDQLFDLAADPDELQNLAGRPETATVEAELRTRLLERVVLQDHPHPPRNLYALGVH